MIKNIIFAGTPLIAANLLEDLIKFGYHISACYTRPDKPQGRNQKLTFSAVKDQALIHNIPIFQPDNLKSPDLINTLKQLKPDLMIVFAYGLILPKEILMIPKFGCFNVHTSLLPRWRGAAPVQHAILAGDQSTGISIIKMEAGLDTGDICYTIKCPITNCETSDSLYKKLQPLATHAVLKVLELLNNNQLTFTQQNHTIATYATKFNKLDAKIDWSLPAEQIDKIIRAFIPTPIAFTEISEFNSIYNHPINNQTLLIRIWQASILDITPEAHIKPGNIINVSKQGIDVATGFKVLRLEKLQFPGSKALYVSDLLNSAKYKNFFNNIFKI